MKLADEVPNADKKRAHASAPACPWFRIEEHNAVAVRNRIRGAHDSHQAFEIDDENGSDELCRASNPQDRRRE
jgi:hypothetical protein